MKILKTGIPTLDSKLLGGIPAGYMVLIEANPGAGMELFAKQIVQGGEKNETKVLFTTSEPKSSIQEIFKKFNWQNNVVIQDIGSQYYENVVIKELQSARLRFEGLAETDIARLGMASQVTKRIDFLQMLSYEVSKINPPFRVVIDSIDFFLQLYPAEQVISILRLLKAHCQQHEGFVAFTMHKDIYESRLRASIETLADCFIELDAHRVEETIETKLIVRKLRNHPEKNCVEIYSVGVSGIQIV